MKKMYVEIALISLLVSLMYFKCPTLKVLGETSIGKLALILMILYMMEKYGRNVGVLSALVMIALLYKTVEGFASSYPPKDQMIIPTVTHDDGEKREREIREKSERCTMAATGAHGGEKYGAVKPPF